MSVMAVSCGEAGAETPINVLPNEILLSIFRYFDYEDLLRVEQVCWKWKTVVEMCFATKKRLSLTFEYGDYSYSIKQMERYGSSIKTLRFFMEADCASHEINWAGKIADRFPNLITMELYHTRISDDGFNYLSTKCCQLKNVTLHVCGFTIEGLRIFLQALPGIKLLNIYKSNTVHGLLQIPRLADILAVVSKCRNLHTFIMGGSDFRCINTASFSRFFKECVTLRTLRIQFSYMPKEMFAQIQHCSLLEELNLAKCREVDDSSLIEISKGCPNLRVVSFILLNPHISDEGLKCFAQCKNLYSFFACEFPQVTDETLVELSKCVNLREVKMWFCPLVSDRGCAALLAQCPRLEVLDVKGCKGVSNETVDSATEAVKCRHNGLVLHLKLGGTSVTPQKYENCHPLLHLTY